MKSARMRHEEKARVIINGRFLARPATGVDRVAERIVRELDNTAEAEAFDIVVAVPPCKTGDDDFGFKALKVERVGKRAGPLWEQIELPLAFPRSLIVNLCNTAPALGRNNIVVMHDALVFDEPQSYSLLFREWYKFLLPRLARAARCVVTVSDHSARRLRAHNVVGAETPLIVIPNGGDHMLDDDGPAPEHGPEHPFVLFVGSPVAHKNLGLLYQVARRFDKSIDFRIAGAVDSAVFKTAAGAAPPNMHFEGRITNDRLRQLYRSALCLAFPSRNEGFGLPPLEAMSLGCPVISADCEPMREILGEAALYAPWYSAGAWCAAIKRLHGDADLAADFRRRGHERVSRYSWRRAGEGYAALLRANLSRPEIRQ